GARRGGPAATRARAGLRRVRRRAPARRARRTLRRRHRGRHGGRGGFPLLHRHRRRRRQGRARREPSPRRHGAALLVRNSHGARRDGGGNSTRSIIALGRGAMLKDILSYGIGTLTAFVIVAGLAFLFIRDITQKKHSVLRNYPIVGRFRYFFEQLGEYFRQYFFAGDRDEMPFNRATRGWVYRLAKNEGGTIGFGSTYDLHQAGALIFVNHPFPVLEEERLPTPSLVLGEGHCREPFEARSIVNVSGMSFGAISAPAVRSLSRGANVAGCWMDTGEGGLSPYHLEGGSDVIMQIGTAKYGVRDAQGNLSPERLLELSKVVKAFEIKLSQGAKPGKGGVLPGRKVTPEIAHIRGIPEGRDSISPNRHRDISNMNE